MQETTSKCRALFRPMLCVWLSLLLAFSPALKPRQAKAIAFADDVGLALMVLSVLGYGVAAWQYSADQTSVDQLAATLSSFPTADVGAAVHDGFLYVGELADSTIQQIGTWYNSAVNTLQAMANPITPPANAPISLTNNGYTAQYMYWAPYSVAYGHDKMVQAMASAGYSTATLLASKTFGANDTNYEWYQVGEFASVRLSRSDTVTWTPTSGAVVRVEYQGRFDSTAVNDTVSSMGSSSSAPLYFTNTMMGMLGGTLAGNYTMTDIPADVAPDLMRLTGGTVAPADWPTTLTGLGDAVVAPAPTTTPTEVPSTEYPEWVWTPADDEALADWIERHKTGTQPDPEDPEDPDEDESKLPSPIPWWWPWDKPAPDVWTDIEGKIDEWTDPSFDPSPSTDPDAGPGDGIGSLPANPDGPTPDPDPDKPTGDKTWDDIGYDLSHVFPFCLPFDLSRLLGLLVTDPVTPVLSWATPDPAGGNVMMSIDLSPWDPVAAAVRKVEILLFAAYLIVKTRDIMS